MTTDTYDQFVNDIVVNIIEAGSVPDAGTYAIINSCIDILTKALTDNQIFELDLSNQELDITGEFNSAVYYGYQIWCKVVKELNDIHFQEQVTFTYLMIVLCMTNTEYMTKDIGGLLKNAVEYIIEKEEENLRSEISDTDTPCGKSMSDDEIAQLFSVSDDDLVKDFFSTFSSMSSFHRDINKYTDASDVDKHNKLMWIYNRMLKQSGFEQI